MPGKRYDYPCNWLQILENAMDPVHASFLHTIVAGTQFTDEFGVIPNLDFMETPAGAISMGTRRVGDNVWVRTTECVLPNVQQIAPIWNDGKRAGGGAGWPHDDALDSATRRHQHDDSGASPYSESRREGTCLVAGPGPDAACPASHIRRLPGPAAPTQRLQAQVSQRSIAVHGLEHLGATDRGVTMFRRQLRRA